MKELTDEILNKYVDGELTPREISELKNYFSAHPDELDKLKAHKMVDEILKEMDHLSPSAGFTGKVMDRISVAYTAAGANGRFLKIVLSFLGVMFIGFFTAGIMFLNTDRQSTSPVFGKVKEFFNGVADSIFSLDLSLNNNTVMIILSALALIVLVSLYIFINSHKAFKQKVENLSH